jgi:hypothetical protein
MPPYCIANIEKAKASMIDYIRRSSGDYLTSLLDGSSKLLVDTFKIAARCDVSLPVAAPMSKAWLIMRKMTERPLVRKALAIWVATRLTERTWTLCGEETLGVNPCRNNSDPWEGQVPVTPIMDQQLDQVVIREILIPSASAFLNKLKEKVYNEADRKATAFEIYLTFFVLLSNAEMQIAHSRRFAQRYGFSVSSVVSESGRATADGTAGTLRPQGEVREC